MLRKLLLAGSVVAGVAMTVSSPAVADPQPAPPAIPNVFAYMPQNPADYTVNGGKWFAFAGPPGVVCVLDSLKGDYGCAGPLPGAPDGVNLVSAGPAGAPTFSTTAEPAYAAAGPAVRPLAPNTRLSFRQVSCGMDADGVVACLNSREQVGFVVGPTATYIGSNRPPAPTAVDVSPITPGTPPA